MDEFGTAPSHSVVHDVVVACAQVPDAPPIDLTHEDTVAAHDDALPMDLLSDSDDRNLLMMHQRRAKALGINLKSSEWYEISRRSAPDRENFLQALAVPRSSGGASSSRAASAVSSS